MSFIENRISEAEINIWKKAFWRAEEIIKNVLPDLKEDHPETYYNMIIQLALKFHAELRSIEIK